ncbi:hypothetical protein BB559_005516 [Furculomyces boomerangus]|uniref:SEC63 domain-containing protein n=1 Tax=Furculomyces boomerangus TaxID=61424 RepID=A0A2T9Y8A6_9FUNG|nr:hypothetical protein BB559_005516 [Furculomyces boomerangus]
MAKVVSTATRVVKCAVEYYLLKNDTIGIMTSIQLCQYLSAECFDKCEKTLRQADKIGPKYANVLYQAGIKTIQDLIACGSGQIETFLHRNPPFGSQVIDSINSFPKIKIDAKKPLRKYDCVEISLVVSIINYSKLSPKTKKSTWISIVVYDSKMNLVKFGHAPVSKLSRAEPFIVSYRNKDESDFVQVFASSDNHVGMNVEYRIPLSTPDNPSILGSGMLSIDQEIATNRLYSVATKSALKTKKKPEYSEKQFKIRKDEKKYEKNLVEHLHFDSEKIMNNREKYFKPKGIKEEDFLDFLTSKKCKSVDQGLFFIKARKWNKNQVIEDRQGNKLDGYRLSIITSKRQITKLAVTRNRARRRVRNAFQLLVPDYGSKNVDYLVIAKNALIAATWKEIIQQCQVGLTIIKNKL